MDFLMMGVSVGTLQVLAGVFVVAIGLHCLPLDLRRPWAGGLTGVPLDAVLIILGVLLIIDGALT